MRGTQPVRRVAKGPTAALASEGAALQSVVQSTVARVGKHLQALEQRIELMVRALQGAQLPIPGVTDWTFKHAVSPQGKKIISYIEKVVVQQADLTRQMQMAVFRYHEARDAVERARGELRAGTAGSHTIEEVKRTFYPLTNLHVEFRHDSLLAQMFPPPAGAATPGSGAGTGMLQARGTSVLAGADGALRYQKMRQAAVAQGEALVRHLTPGMQQLQRIIELQRPALGAALLDLFNAQARHERLLAQRLKEDAKAGQLAASALEIFEHLKEQVAEVKKGSPFEPLAEQMEFLANLLGVWHQHPLLREFFPGLKRDLFFVKR
jgi:hypothetical protein